MKKALTAGFASLLLTGVLSAPASALTVGDVDVPDTYSAMGQELKLNGAGTRSKWFMDLYVGGLYVPEQVSDGEAVINADEPQAITLHIEQAYKHLGGVQHFNKNLYFSEHL